ncbi:prenyltransferase [Micromonospora sp. PLK6-60]|uniref:prenyltransferase/squalene oxidase repeat-containing protein n=1 Tax=Micromonospora sp. PLK6-60 TaxID=2873383 RepID=UPI001CA717DC|nr:prenyltransferase/squalene oxidase repeat-containing protein [Micromonospora sp. PLK6-60]MBY8872582.1 prenyltransferase [Micromonospora sp. PLK6-60]
MTAAPSTTPGRAGTVPGQRAAGAGTPGSTHTAPADPLAAAHELVVALAARPAGSVSPSVYETARVVSDAPWLGGHAERLRYLLAGQRPDGAWGAPGGYALVPTVSAVEALLRSRRWPGPHPDEVARAATRGLAALRDRLLVADEPVPDTPGVDLILPELLDRIGVLLAAGDVEPGSPAALPLPRGMTRRRSQAVGALLVAGRPVPQKLWHAFEALAVPARAGVAVRPVHGAVGASPAATAAWLGDRADPQVDQAALGYLVRAAGAQDGPVPCTTPITVFERAWVLASLARAGAARDVPERLLTELAAAIGPTGAATSPGLPTDADTTSVALYALARLGRPVPPDSLREYDTGAHFCTWRGEDGSSVTTNAHVLEALGWHARHAGSPEHASAAQRVAGWLLDGQLPDGSWTDRWHASAYYATASVAVSLAGYAPDRARRAVDRAVDWVLASQRADGSWGRWGGTAEETAYALHVLLGTGRPAGPGVAAAVRRAVDFLDDDPDGTATDTPLWHDKDLYHPVLIVRAAVVAARQLVRAAGYPTR